MTFRAFLSIYEGDGGFMPFKKEPPQNDFETAPSENRKKPTAVRAGFFLLISELFTPLLQISGASSRLEHFHRPLASILSL